MQTQAPQPAQVALAKPPVVSVPAAVVSSPGVTTLPMNVAGISVAIGQPQKAAGAGPSTPSPPGLEPGFIGLSGGSGRQQPVFFPRTHPLEPSHVLAQTCLVAFQAQGLVLS